MANAYEAQVNQLVLAKDLQGLVELCESHELELASHAVNESPSYTVMILSYLALNDLPSAKYCWKRVPDQYKQGKDIHAAWAVGKAMWTQDVKGVYAAIRAHKWNPLLEKIVAILEDRYRQRTIELVSRAYSNLKLADLAVFLGASVDEATKFAQSNKWAVAGEMVSPSPLAAKTGSLAVLPTPAKSLASLTDFASYMETAQ